MKKYFTVKNIIGFIRCFIIILFSFFIILFSSCDNISTRTFGGRRVIELPEGEKLLITTWDENSLWVLLEPMDKNYVPKTKRMMEISTFGVLEGEIIFIERR